ncbi:hypothetical protein [Cellulomonas soli]|uniref:Uncharacterized protein n=1 Tax=Cellulomonas soli TaxID=931535 RepID=A0A512PCW6_9CELL|nr:hypothetical protein [Cellulomonas soli]NYI58630.1 hypothetical protein [Cellulomonas soli]GEP69055.1 hypothetical protein CSO01_17700 [Cellulomonas soli]
MAQQGGRRWVLIGLGVVVALGVVVLVSWLTRPSFLFGQDSDGPHEAEIVEQYAGLPPGVEVDETGRGAFVDTAASQIVVYTSGSSTCPVVPTTIEVVDDTDVVITLAVDAPPDSACTADYVVTTSVIALPGGLAASDVGDVTLVDG